MGREGRLSENEIRGEGKKVARKKRQTSYVSTQQHTHTRQSMCVSPVEFVYERVVPVSLEHHLLVSQLLCNILGG
jgi:hypothetical protein